MAIVAYRYYRLILRKNSNPDQSSNIYFTINEFGLYADSDHSGPNLCVGATATAQDRYQADSGPENTIDGNEATYWESAILAGGAASGNTKWIKFDLGTPQEIRSLYLSSTRYPNEVPVDWDLQASNDDATWVTLREFRNWTAPGVAKFSYEDISLVVGGVSKLDNDQPSSRVLVYDWITGELLQSIVPKPNGSWNYRPSTMRDVLVTHIGPSGFRPLSDGPITPYAE